MTETEAERRRDELASVAKAIQMECEDIASMLTRKNAAYGDSALNPVRIFSRADRVEQIRVRIDDKLSRMVRGRAAGEDVVSDLIGYLILLRIAQRQPVAAEKPEQGAADAMEQAVGVMGLSAAVERARWCPRPLAD